MVERTGTEGNSAIHAQWRELAGRVAAIIQVSGINIFQQAVRKWAFEQIQAEDRREQHEKERLVVLMRNGVQFRDGSIPDKPGRDCFFHLETLRGRIKLPPEIALFKEPLQSPEPPACLRDKVPNESWSETDYKEVGEFLEACAAVAKKESGLFEHVKQRGFPVQDGGCFSYELDVCAWLPNELRYDHDPLCKPILPLPRRALSDTEKLTILAAVYDANWRGAEKIAPWGVSKNGNEPDPWPLVAERGERRAALSYFNLFQKAENIDIAELPVISSWLNESELLSETRALKKAKRSTERNEGRAKLISALSQHHKYADGSCMNQEPVGNNELARIANVSNSTASAFFKNEFDGHSKYRRTCSNATSLITALKLLNQDFAPHQLFGAKPPSENEREDED